MYKINSDNFINSTDVSKITSSSSAVVAEIGYIYEILKRYVTNTELCKSKCLTIANGTPMTYVPAISGVKVLNGGEGYFPVIPQAIAVGSGTGAILELRVEHGIIISVTVVEAGFGYDDNTTISIENTYGAGADFTVNVANGSIATVYVNSGGEGYLPIFPEIRINTDRGFGSNLLVGLDLEKGSIKSVEVDHGGYNYEETDTITVIPSEFTSGVGAYLSLTITKPPYKRIDATPYYDYMKTGLNTCMVAHHIQQVKTEFIKKGFLIEALPNDISKTSIMWKICWK